MRGRKERYFAPRTTVSLEDLVPADHFSRGIQRGFAEDISALSHEVLEWLNGDFRTKKYPRGLLVGLLLF